MRVAAWQVREGWTLLRRDGRGGRVVVAVKAEPEWGWIRIRLAGGEELTPGPEDVVEVRFG